MSALSSLPARRLLSSHHLAPRPFCRDTHLVFRGGECVLSRPTGFSNRHRSPSSLLHRRNLMIQQFTRLPFPLSRLNLDNFSSPSLSNDESNGGENKFMIGAGDVRKLIQFAQVKRLREKLKALPKECVSYVELVDMCRDWAYLSPLPFNSSYSSAICSPQQIAQSLDQSGNVLVLGDTVFLHPERVARAVRGALDPFLDDDPLQKELKKMEMAKKSIENRAERIVKKELWCSFAVLVAQTIGCMRLTFWELSWDVMEPICFFTTSIYFIAGYAFFLATSRNPSFDSFFRARLAAKRKKLMRETNFNVRRLNELQNLFKDHH